MRKVSGCTDRQRQRRTEDPIAGEPIWCMVAHNRMGKTTPFTLPAVRHPPQGVCKAKY
ncbi:hypothetical protein [Methanogenium cariaci]|uniref:hypothetical protein n=1 Tax=Methanogenium cariaci TaxID=2197 RepID=UPI0012F68E5E|nr:hypothetical protein [Methanogenium cariaci]